MTIAIILAGGKGVRAKKDIPKQFVKVLGRPIIAYTLDIFEAHDEIDAVEVVCLAGWQDELWKIVNKEGFQKVKWVVEGGKDFQQSVRHGVEGLEKVCSDDDIVVVHTGVAPFLAVGGYGDTPTLPTAETNLSPKTMSPPTRKVLPATIGTSTSSDTAATPAVKSNIFATSPSSAR